MIRIKVFIATVMVTALVIQEASAEKLPFIPRGGLSQPVGSTAETWKAGFMVELDYFQQAPTIDNLRYGARIGYHYLPLNAKELLQIGERDFEVEKREGWNSIGELSGIASYRLAMLPGQTGSIRVEAGIGIFYISRPDVYVKGYFEQGSVALNREIYLESKEELTAGISIGFSMDIINRIEPLVRYHYIFTSEEGTSILTLGIGLLAH
ncbi:hypothetical protein HQ587_00925 [bacterium]|nr:hypothetical protein [bacterium]